MRLMLQEFLLEILRLLFSQIPLRIVRLRLEQPSMSQLLNKKSKFKSAFEQDGFDNTKIRKNKTLHQRYGVPSNGK